MNAPFTPDTLETLRARLDAKPLGLLAGSEWTPAASGETFEVVDPSTGEVIARAAAGGAADVDRAVGAARKAFDEDGWPRTPPAERARLLLRLAELIEANAEELALLETLDIGRPIGITRHGDIAATVDLIRYNAGWATKIAGECLDVSAPGEWHAYTVREPVGVAAQIVPWNFPLVMAAAKLAPALAAGCTVVIKPAEQSPLSTVRLAELALEAGIPAGVVNVVTGYGETAGAALAGHPGVDKIAFTGSTTTGRAIIDAAKAHFTRVTLELGGKSPTFVFADADLDKAIPAAAMSIFFNAGQVCAAGSRLFVHEAVADQVAEGVAAFAKNLNVGGGLEEGSQIGPIVSDTQLDRVLGYIESGKEEGASVLVGGGRMARPGYFVEPTVLVDTTDTMRVRREEIFGPVLCMMRFSDADDLDAIAARGNETNYGLTAQIFTRDLSTAHRLARRLKAGGIRINGSAGPDPALPLGGFKHSGWGRENGRAGVEAYTELKAVQVAL